MKNEFIQREEHNSIMVNKCLKILQDTMNTCVLDELSNKKEQIVNFFDMKDKIKANNSYYFSFYFDLFFVSDYDPCYAIDVGVLAEEKFFKRPFLFKWLKLKIAYEGMEIHDFRNLINVIMSNDDKIEFSKNIVSNSMIAEFKGFFQSQGFQVIDISVQDSFLLVEVK